MKTYKEIWDVLSQVNVSDKIMKKNNLSYLSWAHCHEVMMEHFPEYRWETTHYAKADGTSTNVLTYKSPEGVTAGVEVTVTIGELTRSCYLPCMTGYSNKATNYPNARDVNDTIQRCYVKACALFGLGVSLYWGEDIPKLKNTVIKNDDKDIVFAGAIEQAPHKREKQPATEKIADPIVEAKKEHIEPKNTETIQADHLSSIKEESISNKPNLGDM